jgi:hypothetical protein
LPKKKSLTPDKLSSLKLFLSVYYFYILPPLYILQGRVMNPHIYKHYVKRFFINNKLLGAKALFIPSSTATAAAFYLSRSYHNNTTDYTEGTHQLNSNQLDDLLGHLESTKVSDPRTVSMVFLGTFMKKNQ